MNFINYFFILVSLVLAVYVFWAFRTQKRTKLIHELFFVGFYLIIALFFAFPKILQNIENIFGITSAINFFVYLAILVAYILLFSGYKKLEKLRVEITQLTREIAYLHHEQQKSKKPKSK